MAYQFSFGPRFAPRSAPVTFWFIIAAAVVNLALFFGGARAGGLLPQLVYDPSVFPARPWTLFTSPLINYMDPFWFLLLGYVFWWVGAEQEQWWGSRVQAGFLAAVAVGTGLMLALSTGLFSGSGPRPVAAGAGALLCGLFTVWCLRFPDRQVILLFVPIAGRFLLVLELAMLWWAYGPVHGLFAVLGSGGLAALYYYRGERFHRFLRDRRRPPRPRASREERQRERRFRQIMESSGLHLVEDDEESKA